ncbi:HEAT repeat domain-containing protein [Streptomyces sp. NPDC092952]|uniref:HEAT repeat domain-containing protein n=1 Tax=Streptomyces sp. NPDC092952 TaxID=3366018 RepID=UPI0037F724F8
MNPTRTTAQQSPQTAALWAGTPSVRLRAALAAGADPDPALLETLVERCAAEPDFFVRDMLSWALTRLPRQAVLSRIREELGSAHPQARSQALHTLSKINDRAAWAWITDALLRDPDDETARTAWRTAVLLVPEGEEENLAGELARQLGRGDRDVRLSLSRALAGLGEAASPALERAAKSPDPETAAHARATEILRKDPRTGFDAAVEAAKRETSLGPERAATATATAAAATGTATATRTPGTTDH